MLSSPLNSPSFSANEDLFGIVNQNGSHGVAVAPLNFLFSLFSFSSTSNSTEGEGDGEREPGFRFPKSFHNFGYYFRYSARSGPRTATQIAARLGSSSLSGARP